MALEVHGLGSSSENDHFKRRIQEVKQVSNAQRNKRNGLREIEASIDLDDEKAVVEMSASNRNKTLRQVPDSLVLYKEFDCDLSEEVFQRGA